MKQWWVPLVTSALIASLSSPRPAAASCGQAFCTIEMMPTTEPPAPWQLRLDAQMEYIEQDEPWVRYHSVEVGDVVRPDHQEVETTNLTWKLRADFAVNEHWSFGLALPIVHREHLHLGPVADDHDDEIPSPFKRHSAATGEEVTIGHATGIPERWDFTDIGDIELTARYSHQGSERLQDWSFSVYAGLKVPSGRTGVRNGDGEEAEITLQPGTGSVDPLVGGFAQYSFLTHDLRDEPSRVPLFASLALHTPGSDGRFGYRPGLEAIVAFGAVYPLTKRLDLLGQLNFRYKDRDHVGSAPGVPAEHTGGETLHASPGLRVWLFEKTALYSYIQAPLLRRVNGIQLVSDWNLLFGISHEINL